MRVFVGFLILASLFAMAASWQSRHTARMRREREQLHGRSSVRYQDPPTDFQDSLPSAGQTSAPWSTLVIGRPSGKVPHRPPTADGAPSFDAPEKTPFVERAPLAGSSGAPPPSVTPAAATPAPFLYRVRRGDVLGTICADFYGRARGPFENLTQLTLAVARYNDLATPDDIDTGSEIKLPSLNELAP